MQFSYDRYLHLILLSKKLSTPGKILNFHSAISYLRFEHMPYLIASENCWFLWKGKTFHQIFSIIFTHFSICVSIFQRFPLRWQGSSFLISFFSLRAYFLFLRGWEAKGYSLVNKFFLSAFLSFRKHKSPVDISYIMILLFFFKIFFPSLFFLYFPLSFILPENVILVNLFSFKNSSFPSFCFNFFFLKLLC